MVGKYGDFQNLQSKRKYIFSFVKSFLGLSGQRKMIFVYGELGRSTIQNKVLYSIMVYWFRILEAQDTKFIKLAYQLMLNDIELSHTCVNWASKVKLLTSLGFHEVWVNQGVGNKNVFLQVLNND